MKLFSQRMGLGKVKAKMQVNSLDNALRNRLWNTLRIHYLDLMRSNFIEWQLMKTLMEKFYDTYFKAQLDSVPDNSTDMYKAINEHFILGFWYGVYDFLEFIVANHPDEERNQSFMEACNEVLETELSAYRFVGKQITPITSEEEIAEIEEALETPLKTVRTHLEDALKLLSDRKSPDYRNSIKESISAVEAICRLITRKQKATLGQALKEVENKIPLHGALKKAFSNLYGYTSSAEGIRHALLDEPKLSFEDAKFMLVSCSAFINYLVSKASKAGIKM